MARRDDRRPLRLVTPGGWYAGPRAGGAAFSPLSLAPFFWLDPSDLSTLFQISDGTIPVTADDDPIGDMVSKTVPPNGLIQSAAGLRPTYQTAGGVHWAEADGSDDFLDATTIAVTQPFTVVSAWRILAYPGTFSFLWGSGANQEYGLTINPTLLQMTANNFMNDLQVSVPAEGADFIVAQIYNGASSTLRIIGGAEATGNAGASDLAGVNLFARAQLSVSNARMYGMIAVDGVLSDATINQLAQFLDNKLP